MNDLRSGLNELLRSCVQCGLCLPHCATYLASGNEVLSPRGRLLLLDDLLSGNETAPDSYLAAFDQCIGCRACETVCPSGVPFELMAHGQQLAVGWRDQRRGTVPRPAVPGLVLRQLDSTTFLRTLGTVATAAREVCHVTLGSEWRRRLASGPGPAARLSRLLGSLPTSPASDDVLVRLLDQLVASSRVQSEQTPAPVPDPLPGLPASQPLLFFRGCANAGLLAATSKRLLTVLAAAGYAVEIAAGQDCCGALASHTGRPGRAARLQGRNRAAFGGQAGHDAVPIVVEAAGCALELKSYGADFAARVVDAVSLLAAAPRPVLRPVPLKVAFHDPCHARHGLGVHEEPRQLLAAIPLLTWCEAAEKEVCCGSGGAWGLRYPQMSSDLARRKAADLAATGADLVVTTNPGCLGQIADGLALEAPHLPILPLTDLWWYASRENKK